MTDKRKAEQFRTEQRFTHDILPRILPRRDENVVPGQRQKQSQRNHIKIKVPDNNGENLSKEKKERKNEESVDWERKYLITRTVDCFEVAAFGDNTQL